MNALLNDPVSFIRGLGVVLAAIVLATLVPAWGASRKTLLTALRHEETEGACTL